MDKVRDDILSKIHPSISSVLSQCDFENLCEIRFRSGRPLMLYYPCGTYFCKKQGGITLDKENALICTPEDIAKLIGTFCKSSVYAYQNEIKEGFITISGGHRVGICGKAVVSDGKVSNITNFSGINIRIAREYKNCGDKCVRHIYENGRIYNSIIISPPGVGKTTVLRDIARQLSKKHKVSVIDERSEIAASVLGIPQFDVGIQTDVLDGFPKAEGIICALRSLSPDVIITDEIGTDSDICAVKDLLRGGCKIVTTMHGYSVDEAIQKKSELLGLFERAILLERRKGVPEATQCLKL